MEKITLTRKDLYDLIWSEPMLSISRKYKISDTGLRKMCLRLRIPTPYPGYWRQVERRKNPKKPRLNPNYSGTQTSITLEPRADGESLISPFVILRDKIKSDYAREVTVPKRLTKPHRLVSEASDVLLGDSDEHKRSLRNEGVLHNYGGLNVSAAPINVRYALRLLNAIINLFIKRGYQVEKSTFVKNGNRWAFSLKERLEKIEGTRYPQQAKPTGYFALKIESSRHTHRWYDSKNARIASKLADILATVDLSAKALEEEQARERRFQEERQERQRIELEVKQRYEKYVAEQNRLKEKELSEFRTLAESADRWFRARIIRNYINEVMRKAMSQGTLSEEQIDWVVWAKKKCNWYDPLVNAPDEILKDVDKNTLGFGDDKGK